MQGRGPDTRRWAVDGATGATDRRRPVLVTGSHRSGSTFVGKMLAVHPGLGYIREPFGLHHRPGVLPVRFPYWFPYVCAENEAPIRDPVGAMYRFRFRTGAALKAVRSPRDLGLVVHDRRAFGAARRRGARPLQKDPIAVFSAAWLADRFDAQVIVLIRHPAGFASSLMRYGWTHPFDHFLRQPLLMRDLLSTYEDQVAAFARTAPPIIDQAILLWNLIHHTILGYRRDHTEWSFHRHEDISADPVTRFGEMFSELGLPMGDRERAAIEASTSDTNPSESTRAGTVRRSSKAAAASWRTRLSAEEIHRIRTGTEEVASAFYSDDDW